MAQVILEQLGNNLLFAVIRNNPDSKDAIEAWLIIRARNAWNRSLREMNNDVSKLYLKLEART